MVVYTVKITYHTSMISLKGTNLAVLIIGIILASLFAASTAYSSMKSVLTVAAGIPGAIIGSMFIGFVISGIINVLTGLFMNVVNNTMTFVGRKFYKWKFSMEVNPLLLGIGFIVGLEVSLTMFVGTILSNFGIAPLIGYLTDMVANNMNAWNDASVVINQMDVNWSFNRNNRNIKPYSFWYDNSFISYINISIRCNGMDFRY